MRRRLSRKRPVMLSKSIGVYGFAVVKSVSRSARAPDSEPPQVQEAESCQYECIDLRSSKMTYKHRAYHKRKWHRQASSSLS